MKANTTKQYNFNADYYSYTVVTSADQTITTNEYTTIPQLVSMDIRVSFLGDLEIDSLSKMQIDGVIANIRDANNEEIYENGRWAITQTMPRINSLSLKDGYAYRAVMISGDI